MDSVSIKLDKEEVLAHLKHILGKDIVISDEQLQYFMHDLRKLIRRDQKRLMNFKVIEDTRSSNCTCNCHGKSTIISEDVENDYAEVDNNSECESSASTSTRSKPSEDKVETILKPTSSFIRPWQTRPPPSTGPGRAGPSRVTKEDPVKLYHHYKDVWKQNHIPGETGHSGLRWNIREKMLGQNPQPRDDGCSCPCCKSQVEQCYPVNACDTKFQNVCQGWKPVSRISATSRLRL